MNYATKVHPNFRAAFAVLCFCGAPALTEAAPAQAVRKAAPRPTRPPTGPGSLTGVWVSSSFSETRAGPPTGETAVRRTAEGAPPPLQPWAQEVVDRRIADAARGHPYATTKSRCLPGGTPASMAPPAQLPIQILENPGQVTVLFEEFTQFRIIRMNAAHLEDPDPTYFGDSVGRWEGGALVVDTVALTTETAVDGLIPHSEALHVVERFRRTGKDTMEILVTLDDPKAFNRPWSRTLSFKSVPGVRLKEYVCENDRNTPDASGNTGVQLPSANYYTPWPNVK